MKTQLSLAVCISILVSCTPPGPKKAETVTKIKSANKYEILIKSFWPRHTNWFQNEIVTKKSNLVFTDSVLKYFKKKDGLDSIALKLDRVREDGSPGNYVAHFELERTAIDVPGLDYATYDFTVLALINSKQAEQLINGKHYHISGKYFKTVIEANATNYGQMEFSIGSYAINKTKFKQLD